MDKEKILLVEDDTNLGTILMDYLILKNFDVTLCRNGEEGFDKFKEENFELCILDIMMPKKDGFTLAKEIREINKNIPIIFLTAKAMQKDKIEGFKIGADDYITKPFNTEELLFRIKAIFKRTKSTKFTFSKNEFNLGKYNFYYNKRELKFKRSKQTLTSKEAELLKMLCDNKNNILRRETALKNIWGADSYFTSRSMDVYITKLRSYLSKDKSIQIDNVHGVGFKLIA